MKKINKKNKKKHFKKLPGTKKHFLDFDLFHKLC